jgi:hypothetical protein
MNSRKVFSVKPSRYLNTIFFTSLVFGFASAIGLLVIHIIPLNDGIRIAFLILPACILILALIGIIQTICLLITKQSPIWIFDVDSIKISTPCFWWNKEKLFQLNEIENAEVIKHSESERSVNKIQLQLKNDTHVSLSIIWGLPGNEIHKEIINRITKVTP